MQKWKFLLFGISGDLAHKYVLPGLGQFAELNKDDVQVELIGYSRSQPGEDNTEKALNKNTLSGKHNLSSITSIQGQYEDQTFLNKIIDSLGENERLVVYFAIPPVLFIKLLSNFCLFADRNIDILIEKPVGQNKQEALEIFKIIDDCRLFPRTHFIDHYLFKSSLYLTDQEVLWLKPFKGKKVQQIVVQALEDADVKGREGYYDENGAIKDFLPSHMISLLDFGLKMFSDKKLTTEIYDSYSIQGIEIGQYEGYLSDINKKSSDTETYFRITGSMERYREKIAVVFESGKKLEKKQTRLIIKFDDNSEVTWEVGRQKHIEIDDKEEILLQGNNKSEHVNMFEDLLKRNYDRFFIRNMILQGWNIYEKVTDFRMQNSIPLRIYKNSKYPPDWEK